MDISVTSGESDNMKLFLVLVLATVAICHPSGKKASIEPAKHMETREQEIRWNVIVDVPKDTYKADRTTRSRKKKLGAKLDTLENESMHQQRRVYINPYAIPPTTTQATTSGVGRLKENFKGKVYGFPLATRYYGVYGKWEASHPRKALPVRF